MPIGMPNAQAIFQNLTTMVLADLHWRCATANMDDIVIYSNNTNDHLKHMKQVLQRLENANLSIKLSKCQWMKPEVQSLGYLVTDQGPKPLPDKVKAIVSLTPPHDLEEFSSFLRTACQYQRFIPSFA